MNSLNELYKKNKIPLSLKIELTNFCNLKCIHCYARSVNITFIDKNKVFTILRQAKELGVIFIHLSGGECLTHPNFTEIYSYAYELNFRIVILSNGTLFTESIMDLFEQKRPYMIELSVYGTNEESSGKVTGNTLTYKETFRAIKRLKKSAINYTTKYILMKENQESLIPFLCFANQNGINYKVYYNIMPTFNNGRWTDLQVDLFIKEILSFYTIDDYAIKIKNGQDNLKDSCNAGKSFYNINCHGQLYLCDFMNFIHEDATRLDIAIQNLQNKIEEYWLDKSRAKCCNCKNSMFCDVCLASYEDRNKRSDCCTAAEYRSKIHRQICELEKI